jgi:hypothetical protein
VACNGNGLGDCANGILGMERMGMDEKEGGGTMKQERIAELLVKGTFVVIIVYELYQLGLSHGDYALQWIHQDNDTILMYSRFWTWLNPYWWTGYAAGLSLYKIYLGIFVVVEMGIQWILFKKNKLPLEIILMTHLTNIMWFWIGGWQNITTTAILSLSFWNPGMLLIFFLVKLPFGWSWSLSDSHWQCVIGSQKIYSLGTQICGPGTFWVNPYAILWHIVEFGWLVAVMTYWGWKGLRWIPRCFNCHNIVKLQYNGLIRLGESGLFSFGDFYFGKRVCQNIRCRKAIRIGNEVSCKKLKV